MTDVSGSMHDVSGWAENRSGRGRAAACLGQSVVPGSTCLALCKGLSYFLSFLLNSGLRDCRADVSIGIDVAGGWIVTLGAVALLAGLVKKGI
jgi:hypothetical protein